MEKILNKVVEWIKREKFSLIMGGILSLIALTCTTILEKRKTAYLHKGSKYTKVIVEKAYRRKGFLNINYWYLTDLDTINASEIIGADDMDYGWIEKEDMVRVKELDILVQFSTITPDYHRIRWDLVCSLDECFDDSKINIWDSIPEGWVKGKY